MSVRVVQRHLSTVHTMQPGQYTTETMHGTVAVACPECGGVSDLEQTPLADGAVPLTWKCPLVCAYEATLQLEAWAEPVLR